MKLRYAWILVALGLGCPKNEDDDPGDDAASDSSDSGPSTIDTGTDPRVLPDPVAGALAAGEYDLDNPFPEHVSGTLPTPGGSLTGCEADPLVILYIFVNVQVAADGTFDAQFFHRAEDICEGNGGRGAWTYQCEHAAEGVVTDVSGDHGSTVQLHFGELGTASCLCPDGDETVACDGPSDKETWGQRIENDYDQLSLTPLTPLVWAWDLADGDPATTCTEDTRGTCSSIVGTNCFPLCFFDEVDFGDGVSLTNYTHVATTRATEFRDEPDHSVAPDNVVGLLNVLSLDE